MQLCLVLIIETSKAATARKVGFVGTVLKDTHTATKRTRLGTGAGRGVERRWRHCLRLTHEPGFIKWSLGRWWLWPRGKQVDRPFTWRVRHVLAGPQRVMGIFSIAIFLGNQTRGHERCRQGFDQFVILRSREGFRRILAGESLYWCWTGSTCRKRLGEVDASRPIIFVNRLMSG